MILVYALLMAVALGWLLGGRMKNYENAPLRLIMLPVAAFLIEAFVGRLGEGLLAAAVLAEYALLFLFIAANIRRWPMWLLAAGTLLNFIVIATNGFKMPVSPVIYDYEALAGFISRVESGELIEYALVGYDAPLWWLGDTIPVTKLVPGLASAGDLFLGAGVFALILHIMKPTWRISSPRRRSRRG